MKKRFLFVLCFALFFVSSAVCKAETLEIGETLTLTASDAPTSYSPIGTVSRTHSWYTDDSSIVEIVSRNGYTCTVRAKSPGTTKITNKQSLSYSTYNSVLGILSRSESGFGGVWSITVPAVEPTGISLPNTLSVAAESSQNITPTYIPSNASSALTWKSSNTNIVTVDDGTIYGIKPGTAKITVETANGYSAVCKVTVTAPDTVLSDIYPINGENNVSVNTDIRFTYNVGISDSSAFSSIKLYDNTAKINVSITKKTDGKDLIIIPVNPLSQGHSYTATVPKNAVENFYGAKNSAEASTTFKVSSLCVMNTVPEMNETDVAVDTNISVTFDGKVESGTNPYGISLKDESGNDVAFGKAFSNNTLIITPKSDLNDLTQYTLTVLKGAVACDGADSEDDVILTFKTLRDSNKVYPPEFAFEDGKLVITAEDNTNIYYTVDGGVPLVSGTLYSAPIAIMTKNIHVRAIAQRNGDVSTESEYRGIANLSMSMRFSSFDGAFRAVAAAEDGYVAVGFADKSDFGTGDWVGVSAKGKSDAIIVKYDFDGNVVWKKNFGGSGDDYFFGIDATKDGYVAIGESNGESFGTGDWSDNAGNGKSDAIIVKYDFDGNIVWKKNFGGIEYDYFFGVAATENDYMVIGRSDSESFGTGDWSDNAGNGELDAIIVKFDSDGNVVWKKNFGGSDNDFFEGIVVAEDGYVVVGGAHGGSFGNGDWSDNDGNGQLDAIIIKYDFNGNVVWKKNFGDSGYDCFYGIAATENSYVVAGYTEKFGESDAIIVKYDTNGNVEWEKDFGGEDDDYFYDVSATESDYVLIGRSDSESFGTGDWSDYDGNGSDDAIIVKYDFDGNVVWKKNFGGKQYDSLKGVTATKYGYAAVGSLEDETVMMNAFWEYIYDSDRYILSESGKAAVSGKDVVVKGDEITVPVYFTPSADTTGVNIELTYPTGLTYLGYSTEYDGVYADNTSDTVTLSGDFSSDDAHIPSNRLCVIARLKFKVNSELDNGSYVISINNDDTFVMDLNYDMAAFTRTQNYDFSVVDVPPKEIGIIGDKEITIKTQYEVKIFPENAIVQGLSWSTSDESIAKVDQNGLLTPLKNGKVTLTVEETESGVKNSINVVVSELHTCIDSILSDTGNFAKAYSPSETERVLYVPRGTNTVKLTFDYSAGSVSYDGGIFFKNAAKAINVTDFPFELAFVKKESGYEDTIYTIKILEKETAEIVPQIEINNNIANVNITINSDTKANLIIAVYDKNVLKSVTSRECYYGETNITTDVRLSGDKIKIMLFEDGIMKPLCDVYEMNY